MNDNLNNFITNKPYFILFIYLFYLFIPRCPAYTAGSSRGQVYLRSFDNTGFLRIFSRYNSITYFAINYFSVGGLSAHIAYLGLQIKNWKKEAKVNSHYNYLLLISFFLFCKRWDLIMPQNRFFCNFLLVQVAKRHWLLLIFRASTEQWRPHTN